MFRQKEKLSSTPLNKKIHPGIKFASFILAIFFIFNCNGFFTQILLGTVILIFYCLCKIPKKNFITILKSILIMFIMFMIINWFLYKNPIAIDISLYKTIGKDALDSFSSSTSLGSNIYVSNIYGGNILNWDNMEKIMTHYSTNPESVKIVNIWFSNSGIKNSDLNSINFPSFCTTDEAKKAFLYLLNNDFDFEGISYKTQAVTNGSAIRIITEMKNSILYTTNWYSLSPISFILSGYISLKVFFILLASAMLTETTTSVELSSGIETLLSPLKIIKFPVNETATILAIAIRFIPSLLFESKRILSAQASRGVDFNNGGLLTKLKALISLVVPLFSIAFRKSDELANAMDARGYNPKSTRTKYRIYSFTYHDFLFLFILIFFGSFVSCINFLNIYFAIFGIAEGFLVI